MVSSWHSSIIGIWPCHHMLPCDDNSAADNSDTMILDHSAGSMQKLKRTPKHLLKISLLASNIWHTCWFITCQDVPMSQKIIYLHVTACILIFNYGAGVGIVWALGSCVSSPVTLALAPEIEAFNSIVPQRLQPQCFHWGMGAAAALLR